MKIDFLGGFSRREKIELVVGYVITMAICLLSLLAAVVFCTRV